MKVFDKVPVKIPAKNVFDLSHDVKSTYNFDKLYPFLVQPVYPGDTWNVRTEIFMRAMPLLAPVMHNVDMRLYFFFVPNRLIWDDNRKDDWKTFITGGEDGTSEPVFPYFTYLEAHNEDPAYLAHGSLLDHMGLPTIDNTWTATIRNGNVKVSQLPFRAYQLVYNEYFRNQNVQNEIEFPRGSGAVPQGELGTLFEFRKKCWEKDYFTSCLPWAQRGQAMTLPISSTPSPVNLPVSVGAALYAGDDVSFALSSASASAGNNNIRSEDSNKTAGVPVTLVGSAIGNVTLTGVQIGTINDFRYCLRLQQWMENNARCGSRYIEQLFAHFGVKSSDARLQRPELLGGGKVPIIFSDIPQTSYGQGETDNVLGDLAGKGTLYGKTQGFKKYFEEHGILLGILTIIPRTAYSQGIPRVWTQFSKTDWFFPEFAHLGEQAVLNKELYYDPTTLPTIGSGPDDPFGYQGRYTELRYIPGSYHGDLRGSLAYWHMGRHFTSLPVLNNDFVTAQTQCDAFALKDVAEQLIDPFIAQLHLSIKAVRPLPKYAVPTL